MSDSEFLSGTPAPLNQVASYRKGGKVKKTGPAKVHKGERVIRKASRKNARSR